MAKWQERARKKSRTEAGSVYRGRTKRNSRGGAISGFLANMTAGRAAKLGFLGIAVLAAMGMLTVSVLAFTLPSPDKLIRREGFSTKILDRNGEVLYDIFKDEKRTPVALNEMPEYLKQATIAIEDKNFYKHDGFDPLGMMRGISRQFTRGRAQGGSTLTQQLVKNVLLTSERSLTRKMKEFVLAIEIEQRYSKDEILELYLNEAPYGGTAWGVESASQMYFGKPVKDVNLMESAFLAGLPQRPSFYSPHTGTQDAYIGRTEAVLRRMREDGYITKEQEEEAVGKLPEMSFQPRGADFKAPHFVQYVQRILEERYGDTIVEQGGLKVTTTLDLKLHEDAQLIVSEEIAAVEKLHITNGSAVIINPMTSEVLAMVGSKDFNAEDYDGQVNVALSLRQPGSAIKPITYVTAFKKGYTPATMVMDVPTEFKGGAGQPPYKPVNYDGQYRGPVHLRYALGNSLNVPAVKTLAMVGVKDMLSTAYDMGLSSLEPTTANMNRFGLAVTLGGAEVRLLDLTSAYGSFVNGGRKVEPVAILKVEDRDGKVLEETKFKDGKQVITPEEAFLVADILSDNQARSWVFGVNSLLNFTNTDVAVKTGTTNDKRDNWTLGGNEHMVVGVWVGNNDNTPMTQVASGISGASPIWRKILVRGLEGKPAVSFQKPDGVISLAVDNVSGWPEHDGWPSRQEYFIKGTEPTGDDPIHTKLKVCRADGKLATPGDVASGNYEEKEYFVIKEEDPSGEPNMWQKGVLNWISQQEDSRYRPPTESCGSGNPVYVEFIEPRNEQSNLSGSMTIKFKAASSSDIELAELFVDGKKVRSFSGPPYEYQTNLEKGVHEIRIFARDKNGKTDDDTIKIGVGVEWNYSPTPSPKPTKSPLPSPSILPIEIDED